MNTRVKKIEQILLRELSQHLHTEFREESVRITLSGCSMAPNFKEARVFYSVLGAEKEELQAKRFFERHASDLRNNLKSEIYLKIIPHLSFVLDPSLKRGARVLEILDTLETPAQEEKPAELPMD